LNTGQQQVSTPELPPGAVADPWNVQPITVNTDPYSMMPEIVRRSYYQQKQLYNAGRPAAAAPAQPALRQGGWEGGTSQAQADALAEKHKQIPVFVKMVGQGPGQTPNWVPAQPWEPGAVAAGSIDASWGYPPPTRPDKAYGDYSSANAGGRQAGASAQAADEFKLYQERSGGWYPGKPVPEGR
jgi:hypothetical protein